MGWFTRLTERRILKTLLEGGLQGLAGEGKPLPNRPGDALVDAGDAAGFRIMAQAGVLPEEIDLKKQVTAQKAAMAGLSGEARKAAMARLGELQMRQAIAEEARRKFMR
ncbi:DnaJ family domain-containing protein [Primorskyibacter sp. 2E107]|uniref:DnaJ family domain-containing protein n=1 Tax=Primorskyibacter sp. 2E107 TaxID=3403458 RepID=UPI003AF60A3E